MSMTIRLPGWFALIVSGLLSLASSPGATPLGSAFNYQGRLLESGVAANGRYELQFTLFTTPVGGVPSTGTVTNSDVLVSNGLFAVTLDFGQEVFSGTSAWLEIGVRPGGATGPFVILTPRQSLTPAPYSIYTLKAESLNGLLPD